MSRGQPIPRRILVELTARSRGRCEIALPRICAGTATDPHHKKLRSRGGSNDLVNLIDSCRACHRAIHDHRPGTERFRTWSWQDEGLSEADEPDRTKRPGCENSEKGL